MGLEPTTGGLGVRCSDRLSYRPGWPNEHYTADPAAGRRGRSEMPEPAGSGLSAYRGLSYIAMACSTRRSAWLGRIAPSRRTRRPAHAG